MELKEKDFVEIDFNLYANGDLVQTSNEAKGKAAKLNIKEYGPQVLVLGKGFILKALDEDIVKNGAKKGQHVLELEAKDAYGPRNKDLIRTFPKSTFDEHQLRPVVGVVYDFNGMYGTVKSVAGGRIMVDFNNPLSGKDIKIEYTVLHKIDDIKKKLETILTEVLRVPKEMYSISVHEKELKLSVPVQLSVMKDMLMKSLEEFVPELKDYKVELIAVKPKKEAKAE